MFASTMDRFVVGTGRCGSTLLSRMLGTSPALLSIFEFFTGLDHGRRFAPGPVDGDELAALLAQDQPVVTMALRRGYSAPEIVYPFGAPGARYGMQDELPWLLVTALSRMSDDPDAWFDATLEFARAQPARPLRDHYRALFAWWAERAGRASWIERSGSSIEYVGDLQALFPEACFLHIHRDGPETALSMREHRLYRLAISFLFDLPPAAGPGHEGTNAEMAALDAGAADATDPIRARLEQELPVEAYGRYWDRQIEAGLAALERLPAGRHHAIRFEALVARPEETLAEVADFFELAGGDWVREGARLVKGAPAARVETLSEAERARLAGACASGMRQLGRV
jgi:hypothetical protein